MSSKQQSSRQSHNPLPIPPQTTKRSLIFSNVSFDQNDQELLRNLKQNYLGVLSVSRLYFRDNDQKPIGAIRIEFKSDELATQFLDEKDIWINDEQYSLQSSLRSLIVSKVPPSITDATLLQDLKHNYLGIESISRFYDIDTKRVADIRIDFKSDSSFTSIVKNNYILIDGNRRPVQLYWSLICNTSQNAQGCDSEKSVVEQSQNYLTERRVRELFHKHQVQLETMINAFEKRLNVRLSSLETSSTSVNADQLLPIVKDLTTVCQQFNQQNAQIQSHLGSIVHRVQDAQIKFHNEQAQQVSLQNGH